MQKSPNFEVETAYSNEVDYSKYNQLQMHGIVFPSHTRAVDAVTRANFPFQVVERVVWL